MCEFDIFSGKETYGNLQVLCVCASYWYLRAVLWLLDASLIRSSARAGAVSCDSLVVTGPLKSWNRTDRYAPLCCTAEQGNSVVRWIKMKVRIM